VQTFTPEFIDAARPARHSSGDRWFVDETYVRSRAAGPTSTEPLTSTGRSSTCWSRPAEMPEVHGGSSPAPYGSHRHRSRSLPTGRRFTRACSTSLCRRLVMSPTGTPRMKMSTAERHGCCSVPLFWPAVAA
jgi:hypothetical protein